MQVTKNITLDLLETGSPVIIKAKQNDRNTRYIAAHLYVDGLSYPVPSGTEIAFRYKKPDGTAGFYDALPDNSPAITVSGNTVTVELVEQVLTAAGCVHCEINMYNAASEKLTTFTFEISVEESVLTDAEIISSDYYNVLTAEIAKALQAVTDATEQAENAAQSAQEAADSAASINPSVYMQKSVYDPGNEQQPLLPRNGDGSNVTAAFTEAEQDADIASGEKLSVLFGKIKKRFSVVNKLVNGAVYPNLLDNSDFTNPVNQRGSTSYSGGGTYCIDRWDIASTATVAVVSDGIKITATTLSGIRQKIENITDGQLLVFQLCDNADTVYTQAFAASTTQAEYTTDFGKFRFVLNSGGVLTISILLNAGERTFKWAKLEKGSVATPYVPKGYGAELAECLRYFQRVHADWRIYPTLKDMLYRFSQSTLQVMRIKPTISAHGTPYTFGCTINALDAQPMAFTVETKITEQGQNSAAASMLGYFDLSADL